MKMNIINDKNIKDEMNAINKLYKGKSMIPKHLSINAKNATY